MIRFVEYQKSVVCTLKLVMIANENIYYIGWGHKENPPPSR